MNTNPAGVFQPMSQHPLFTARGPRVVGGSNMYTQAKQGSTRVLAPYPGALREVSPVGHMNVFITGTTLDNVSLYLKDHQGRQHVLISTAGGGAIPPGGIPVPLLAASPIYLLEEDFEGLYLQLDGSADLIGDMTISYKDYRDVSRGKATLTDSASRSITPEVPPGNTTQALGVIPSIPFQQGYVFNFDSVEHTLIISLSDGTSEVFLNDNTVPAATAPGRSEPGVPLAFFIDEPFLATLPPGWSLRMLMGEPYAGDGLVEVFSYWTPGNYGPVRQDQGGAY